MLSPVADTNQPMTAQAAGAYKDRVKAFNQMKRSATALSPTRCTSTRPTVSSLVASPVTATRSRSEVEQSNGYPAVPANHRCYDANAPVSPISGDDAKQDGGKRKREVKEESDQWPKVADSTGGATERNPKRQRDNAQVPRFKDHPDVESSFVNNKHNRQDNRRGHAHTGRRNPHVLRAHAETEQPHREGSRTHNRHMKQSQARDTQGTRQQRHEAHQHRRKVYRPQPKHRTAGILQQPLQTKDLQEHPPRKQPRATNIGNHNPQTPVRNTAGITANFNLQPPTRTDGGNIHNNHQDRRPRKHHVGIPPAAADTNNFGGLLRATRIPTETTDLFQTPPALTPSDSSTDRTIYSNDPELPDAVGEALTLQAKAHLHRAWQIIFAAFPIGRPNYWHMYPNDFIPDSACNVPDVMECIRNMRTWGYHPSGPDYDKYRRAVLRAEAHLETAVELLEFVEPGKVVRFGGLVGRGDVEEEIRRWGVGVQRKGKFKEGDEEFEWLTAQETLDRWEREEIPGHEGLRAFKVRTGEDADRRP